MRDILTFIGDRFKEFRSLHGYTQEQMAKYLQVDRTLIAKFEKGERSLSVTTLEKACSLLGCTLADLESEAPCSPMTIAFRAKELSPEDMEAVAKIQKLVLNTRKMKTLERKAVNMDEK